MCEVSVCMPTYNHAKYIEQAIKGVLMQKMCDYELIIANDCSTDDTLEVCRRYQRMYPNKIKIINQPQNKGVIGNIKDALMACTGEYIAVCEGDDYWIDPQKLCKQKSFLEKMPDVSMVHTNWKNYYQRNHEIKDRARVRFIKNENSVGCPTVEDIINEQIGIRFSTVCFRKSMLLKAIEKDPCIFNPAYPTFDLSLFIEMANAGRFIFIDEDTTVYRMLDESVSITSNIHKRVNYLKGVLNIKLYYIQKYHLSNSTRDIVFRKCFQTLYPYAFTFKDYSLALDLKNKANQMGYRLRIGQYCCYLGCKNSVLRCLLTPFFSL